MEIHITSKKKNCKVCGKSVVSDRMTQHTKTHNEASIICDICGKGYVFKYHLTSHMTVHECKICHRICKEESSLSAHNARFHSNRRFKCKQCDYIAKTAGVLRVHVNDHNKKYKCDLCPRTFASSHQLQKHKAFHEKPELFKCEICKNIFMAKRSLKNHLMGHAKPKLSKYSCDRCPKNYSTEKGLKLHKWAHNEG